MKLESLYSKSIDPRWRIFNRLEIILGLTREVVKEIRSRFHERELLLSTISSHLFLIWNMVPYGQSRGDQVIADLSRKIQKHWLCPWRDCRNIATFKSPLDPEAQALKEFTSQQQIQDERVTDEEYRKFIEPEQHRLSLEAANEAGASISFISVVFGASNDGTLQSYPLRSH